jgi:hypothetical protein
VLFKYRSLFGKNIKLKTATLDEQLKFNCSKQSKPEITYQSFIRLLKPADLAKYLLSLDKEHTLSLLSESVAIKLLAKKFIKNNVSVFGLISNFFLFII